MPIGSRRRHSPGRKTAVDRFGSSEGDYYGIVKGCAADEDEGKIPVKSSVTVQLGHFACAALVGADEPEAKQIESTAVQAIRCYLNDRELAGPGWRYPRFLPETKAGEKGLPLRIDDELWHELEEEADRQGVAAPRLLEHAAFYFAAEVDAGHVTRRIIDSLDGD